MVDKEKYINTPNRGRDDANKLGWKVGDIFHVSRARANGYNYCGYEEIDLPRETRVRIIGIKQTNLNAQHHWCGIGDVYVDFECVDLKNSDGTPITCGNRHAWSLLEANPDHTICPDGSGDLGMVKEGVWYSYAGEYVEDHRVVCGRDYIRDKVIHLSDM